MEIKTLRGNPLLRDGAAAWFSQRWHIPYEAYRDSMDACIEQQCEVPQWYLLLNGEQKIIAGAGVIENDFHVRKDLAPNLCALWVEEEYRCGGLAGDLLHFIRNDMGEKGCSRLYLLTDHTSFYEKYGWSFLTMAENDDGSLSRVYTAPTIQG